MDREQDSIEEKVENPAEESASENVISDLPVDADATPEVESAPAEVAQATEPEADPVAVPLAEETPAETPVAPTAPAASDAAAPGYGAPQMLYEDFIPYEYLHDTPPASEEAPAAEAESAPPSEEKKKKKDKKPTKEELEIMAAVEAEMASRAEPAPEAPVAPEAPIAPAPVAPVPVAPVTETPVESAAPARAAQEEAIMADEIRNPAPTTREYSPYELKLRKKYAIDNDILLSKNDVIPGFVLAKGEHVVRCYNCINSSDGEGTLCLTNKRLLVNSDDRTEVELDRVSGIKFMKKTHFSIIKLIFAIIFFAIGAFIGAFPYLLSMGSLPFGDIAFLGAAWVAYLCYSIGAVFELISLPFWLTMIKKYFRFDIIVKDSMTFFEYKSPSVFKKERKGKMGDYVLAKADKESEKAARELGALLLEIKAGRYNF